VDKVVDDLTGIINVEQPSVSALRGDLKAYFVAVFTGDTAGAVAEATAFKFDINAIVTALNTPTVNQTRFTHDLTSLSAATDKLMTDELSHNLSATAQDAVAEFAALDALFNDLVAGRYGISL
jgi:hypothetical protein